MVAYTLNPSTWEEETGGPLSVPGQSGLHNENLSFFFFFSILASIFFLPLTHQLHLTGTKEMMKSII